MLESKRNLLKSKAALGLLVTIFVAAACSHKNIKDQDVSDSDLPTPSPVFATEPDANSGFEQAQTEPAPEPIANPIEKQQKVVKHKISKKKKAHKKHLARRHHKKNRKVVRNHKSNSKKSAFSGTAAGTISQLPPPPPQAPMEQLTPPPPPPPFANDAQISSVGNDSAGYQWLYVGTGFALVLAAVGYRYRGKLLAKKSRRLIFNS
jgi:hypothetical protein